MGFKVSSAFLKGVSMKKYIVIVVMAMVILLLSGCNSYNPIKQVGGVEQAGIFEGKEDTIEEETMEEIPIDITKPDDIAKFGVPFLSPFYNGNLYYTINKCTLYQNVADAGVVKTGFWDPFTNRNGKIGDDYAGISNYFDADGKVIDCYDFVLLDIHIKNENATAYDIKYEFLINELVLYGGNPAKSYDMVYFADAYKTNEEQPFHYYLEPGEEMDTQVGYFVMKEDVASLVGIENQSADHVLETYFEVMEE